MSLEIYGRKSESDDILNYVSYVQS